MHSEPSDSLNSITLLQAAEVRRLFGGVSNMWLWRRQKDGTLPPPVVISGRRFWTRRQIIEVIEKRLSESQSAISVPEQPGTLPEFNNGSERLRSSASKATAQTPRVTELHDDQRERSTDAGALSGMGYQGAHAQPKRRTKA
jgi:predicted DNA-binding transcriptional regulator AlpA